MRRVGCAPGEPRGYDEDAESRSNAAAAVSRERIVGRAHELLRRWNLLPSMEERQVDGDRRPVAGAVMARHKDSRKQLSLFEADQADLPFDAYLPPEPRPLAQPGEQLPLFEGKTPLVGEVTAGVLKADFRAAREAYERLRESYPMDKSVSSFEFLSSVPDDFWSETRSDEERLSVWQAVAQCFQTNSTGYLKARDGFFRRLLTIVDARELVVAHPSFAPDIANHLLSADEWNLARECLRDVLLAGKELKPLAFQDQVVSDLLSEEGAPEWLASLGAIRRLWSRHTTALENPAVIQTRLSADLPENDREKAVDFWFCLCNSGLASRIPEGIRHSAHRRMKQLHPTLHEEFMTGRRVT